jgi:long-chain fatty acid transport protein
MAKRKRDETQRIRRPALAIASAVAGLLLAGSPQAGGLYLSTFGTPSMGTASAGSGAIAHDASTALYNPAGMTRLDDHQLVGGLAPGFSKVEFDAEADTPRGGGDGGDQGGFIPISSNQYVHKLSDRWRFGMSLLSISGAALDPKNDWAGRNENVDLSLFSLTLMPTVGVRVTDWLSLGAGVGVTYGKLDFRVRLPLPLLGEPGIQLKGLDDWEAAPLVSVLLEPTPKLRLGVTYQGETDFDLRGKAEFLQLDSTIELELPLAQAVRASLYWDATDHLALMANAGWEDWSVAKTLPISVGGQSTSLPLGFRDTWFVAAGVHYRVSDTLTLQTGLRYDSSALKDGARTTAFPVDRVYTLGVGGLYDWSENLRLGFSFVWSDLGKAPVKSNFADGKFRSNDVYLFGVSLSWKKLPWSGRATL